MNAVPAAIAAASPLTCAAGARIARDGGNAVDIGVAAALSAMVGEILMCAVGGSAAIMVRMPGREPELIEGCDAMPARGADPAVRRRWHRVRLPYGDGIDIMVGYGSIAVPGALAALDVVWRRHGSMPWSVLVAPAIEMAREGFPVGAITARWLDLAGDAVFGHQEACRRQFYPDGRTPVRQGQQHRLPALADTLDVIARDGARTLYEGDLGKAFARQIVEHGGVVGREDLARYAAKIRRPLLHRHRGYTLALNPRPAVGGAAVGSLLGLLELAWPERPGAAEWAFLQASAQSYVLGLRAGQFAEPLLSREAEAAMLEKDALRRRAHAIRSPHTTHMSVVCGDGSAVALSLSNGYGSGITIPGLGIDCNNSLGEPELNPGGADARRPGERLISNMAPTVAWDEAGRVIALGSPGASRITTAIAQVWARHTLDGRPLEEAVHAPRLHVEEWQDGARLQCEPGIDTRLVESEYIIRRFEHRDMFFGAVQLAAVEPDGTVHAVADARRHGAVEVVG